MRRTALALWVSVALLALVAAPAAHAAAVPADANYSEEYIPLGDGNGTTLHAEVLRPKGVPDGVRVPVILTVSPYLNQGGATTPSPPGDAGPSDRFFDFLTLGHVFERGYAYVMVDLPGFGGSGGCNDWGGPTEQLGVKAAVQWYGDPSKVPWSSGKVGMYGKSYDAWTGLMGIAQRPAHLAAVVSQEPVVDGYRYIFMNRVQYPNYEQTTALFQGIDASPGSVFSTPDYIANGATGTIGNPCYANNLAEQASNDPTTPYWQDRDLIDKVTGSTVPLFLNEGFLEDNTKPDQVFRLFNNMAGPKRAWFGQWDHVRGTDVDADGNPIMGRGGYIDEAMRFFDHYVKGLPLAQAPTDRDPPIVVQQGDGRYRAEQSWPPADSAPYRFDLNPGSYQDTDANSGTAIDGSPNGVGVWTFSPPAPYTLILSGTPQLTADVSTSMAGANLVGDVYDVASDNQATLISRGAYLVPASGTHSFELYGEDWPLAAGHRIGVLISAANDNWFQHIKTAQTVTVNSAHVDLPFLAYKRDTFLAGGKSAKLTDYEVSAPFAVDPAEIAAGEAPFAFPPALVDPPGGAGATGSSSGTVALRAAARRIRRAMRVRLRFLAVRSRSGRLRQYLVATGRAPSGQRVRLRLTRNGRTAKVVVMRALRGRFKHRFAVRRRGSYRVSATRSRGLYDFSGRSRTIRLRAGR